ncbi:hypothetical protein KR009_003165, partial [Drosophila setifemur]
IINSHRSQSEGSMVGLICEEGILLATSSRDNLIYHLDERIYCCAPRFGNDRDVMLDVGTQVDYQTRDRGQKMTVVRVKDMVCQKYEQSNSLDILLAGQDRDGLHIYDLRSKSKFFKVMHGAKGGKDGREIAAFLEQSWKASLRLEQAEQLVRKALKLGENDYVDMCFIYKAGETEVEEEPSENPDESI